MAGKTSKDAARLRQELSELRRRKAELESSENLYKKLVAELSRGEDLFRSMADSANDGILVLDEQGNVIYVNRAGESMFGQSADEIIGRRLHETFIPERFRDYASGAFDAHAATGMKDMLGTVREFQAKRENGLEFPLEVSISAASSGERTYYITFCRDITERKQVEEELRESRQRYRDLVENLNDVIFTLDPLGRFSYISPAIESMSDYTVEEIIGQPFTRFVHPDDLQGLLASFERTFSGDLEPYEFRVVDRDDSVIHVMTSSQPLYRNGELIGVGGLMADISERKRAEDELESYRGDLENLVEERTRELGEATEHLQRSERYYRSLIRNAPDMIDVLNEDLTIRWGSPSAGRITGYTAGEIYGHSIFDYVHPEDMPASREMLDRVLENPGKPQNIVVRFRHKDGSYHYHETTVTNLLEDDAVKGIVLNSRDITDRMLLDEELRRSERYFRALIENAYDIIAVLNEDGTMGYLSPSLERISGFKQEERLGKDAFQFFHPDDLPRVMEEFARGLQQPGHTDVVEYRWQHKDGSWHWQEAIASNLIDDPVVRGIVVNARDITDRRQAEAALRESEERYRSLIETSPDCIIMTDLEGKILMVNRSGLRLFKCSDPSEMVGKSYTDFMVQEEILRAREPLREQVDLLEAPIELTSVRPDGSRFISESNSRLLRNAQGDPIGFISITRDITERKRAELALRDSEERYRSLVETSPDSIFMSDLDGNILMVNRSGVALYGYKAEEEMTRMHILDFFVPEERERVKEVMSDASRAEQQVTIGEYTMLRKDGTRFYCEVAASLVRNATGNPVGFLGIGRDITDRKRDEERLIKLNECFLSLGTDPLENIQRFVIAGRDILEADLIRYGRMEKGELYVFSSLRAEEGFLKITDAEDCLCYYLMTKGASESVTCKEVAPHVLEKDPEIRGHGFRSCLYFPISMHGEQIGCLNLLDREDREYTQVEVDTLAMLCKAIEIEEERYAFNESLRDFVDIASHELRHPVALLAGYTETLESHGAESDELTRQEIIAAIRQSAERITRMVMGLVNVSLVERERFHILKKRVDIASLVEQTMREMRVRAEAWGFTAEIPEGIGECEADPDRIHDLLVILMDNAVKYSAEGSDVEIAVEGGEEEVTISVLDRGTGIRTGHGEKIFERFYQVEEAQYHSKPGLGLGLFLARQIVEAHGGSIWHEDREGGGSAFRFTLPCS